MDKWRGERREADGVTLESALRADERRYDRTDIDEDGEKREEDEGRESVGLVTGDLSVRENSKSYVISLLKY